jgi:hypothetical protein
VDCAYAQTGCTTPGSGGGTWRSVISLCVEPKGEIMVLKEDRGAFRSSGRMTLYGQGVRRAAQVTAGVYVARSPAAVEGCHQARFVSDVGGDAWTGTLCVDPYLNE